MFLYILFILSLFPFLQSTLSLALSHPSLCFPPSLTLSSGVCVCVYRVRGGLFGLHAAHAAALDGLFHLLAEGGPVAALEGVFPALHPLAGAAGAGVAHPAALHPGHHARRLADGVASLHLVEVPHGLPPTLGLWRTQGDGRFMHLLRRVLMFDTTDLRN